jgi:hypothetical protein
LAVGVSFHVGSQQRDIHAWDKALEPVAGVFARLRDEGITPALVNIGGGFPGHYVDGIPAVESYGEAIIAALRRHLGPELPQIIAEPGRYLVADAGVMEAEVVLVSRRSFEDDVRWVYIDAGIYNGLAEAQGEAIKYRIVTAYDGGPRAAWRWPARRATRPMSSTNARTTSFRWHSLRAIASSCSRPALYDDVCVGCVQRVRALARALHPGRGLIPVSTKAFGRAGN